MGRFLRWGGTRVRRPVRWLTAVAALGAVAAVTVALTEQASGPAQARARATSPRAYPVSPDAGRSGTPTASAGVGSAAVAATSTAFGQIILPDLLIVAPGGLTARQAASLRAISGVHNMITFDGAEITVGGRSASVIGVNPTTFRPWVPLQTAADQALWSDLARGDFVADTAAEDNLGLLIGGSYALSGASRQVVKFGQAASLGLTGVDLVVNQSVSAKLGLVRQVAGLISAPGVSITTLEAAVRGILGPSGRIEVLRSQQLPVAAVPAGTRPNSYLQLFQASAADYCPGLSWTVLAAIGEIESGDGQNDGPSSAGALGPMQFLPSTWQVWGIDAFGETGPPDVMNPYDAVASAARLLCADGAASGGASLDNAIFDYNHSASYVQEVLALAAEYAADYA